ncbi:hypothetical protein J0H58_06530 [bacterium]|nr:hypothetical protein [bacterium]
MARPKSTIPTYRHHKPTDTARCWVGGRWIGLGRYNSPESRTEYNRIVAELASTAVASAVTPASAPPVAPATPDVSVNELLLGFLVHADKHYRRADGTPTNELPQFRQTFRLVRELYGHIPAREFGPKALKAVRQKMVESPSPAWISASTGGVAVGSGRESAIVNLLARAATRFRMADPERPCGWVRDDYGMICGCGPRPRAPRA